MPLREDILNPISESKPAGDSLRYASVYDKIKDARRQEDDAPQGEWQRERKVADYATVLKLTNDAIATKSKDLQLAAWLTEALLNREGFPGLAQGLGLIKDLVENFWDGLWPELDDGDAEMRAAPIDWIGTYLAIPVRQVPLTKSGFDLLRYQDAKAIGYKPESDYDPKMEDYTAAIAEGRQPLEEFDKAFRSTPAAFYSGTLEAIDKCLQIIEDSQEPFEEKFGDFKPSYGRTREGLEEVRRTVNQFLQKKLELEAPAEPPPEEVPEAPAEEAEPAADTWAAETAAAPVRKASRKVTGIDPVDKEDAVARISAAAKFLRKEDPYSPAPYLMLRGLRWGEIRAASALDPMTFEAPAGDTRSALKRLLTEGSYAEVIETAEAAMAEPCGRAWLDLQRYVVTACEYMGYAPIAEAIRAELKSLIADYPDLLNASLLDDTPCANKETLAWYEQFAPKKEEEAASAPPEPVPVWTPPPVVVAPVPPGGPDPAEEAEAPPDSFELAMNALRGGRTEEAFTILADEIAHQSSGRGRFQRKLQLAQICLSTGHEGIAMPLLEELQTAIDRHQLEEWETPEMVAHALSLLYACAQRTEMEPGARLRLYARICRLSPVQALKYAGHAFAQGR